MYYPDLTPYVYGAEPGDEPALNVGWLDSAYEFPKGDPPVGFLDRLRVVARTGVKQTRGFQVCQFCPDPCASFSLGAWSAEDRAVYQACFADGHYSSAELRVRGNDGRVYASPEMLIHYVAAHSYLPPPAFVDAVMRTDLRVSNEGA